MTALVQRTWIITLAALSVVLLLAAAYTVRYILMLSLIGIGSGVLIAPSVRLIHHRLKLPRWIGVLAFLVLWFAIIAGVGYLILVLLAEYMGPLLERLPTALNAGQARLADLLGRFPALSASIRGIDWGKILGGSVGKVFHGLQFGVQVIGYLIYIIAVSLYFASDPNPYRVGFASLFPRRHHARLHELMNRCAHALRKWFVSQLIAMASVGSFASIGFIIIGLEYWPLLGILTAVLDIVPFVGPTIAAGCAVLVTMGSDPGKVIWVFVNFVVVEHLESNLVVPLAMRGGVDLPPAHLLTFMLILGSWFGILGILLAPPLMTLLRVLYLEVYLPWINAQITPIEK